MLSQQLAVSGAGKLPSLIRVDDEVVRVSTLIKRHTQCADYQGSVEKLAHGPTDHSPGKEIQDCDQV
jgi:hypothetical protein